MADEKTFEELENKESASMDIALSAAMERTAITIEEYIALRRLNGAIETDILSELLDDLNNGGRIFGEFRNAIKATAHGNIGRISDIGQFSDHGVDGAYKWIVVSTPSRVCPDCKPRHGWERTWTEWEVLGLPKTGWSVCKEHCRCIMIPTEALGIVPELPVEKERKKK